MLFLHSVGGNRTSWLEQINAAPARYTAVSFDFRGHHNASAPDAVMPPLDTIKVEEFAADTIALIEKLGFSRAHLVGLSMGGVVAQVRGRSAFRCEVSSFHGFARKPALTVWVMGVRCWGSCVCFARLSDRALAAPRPCRQHDAGEHVDTLRRGRCCRQNRVLPRAPCDEDDDGGLHWRRRVPAGARYVRLPIWSVVSCTAAAVVFRDCVIVP